MAKAKDRAAALAAALVKFKASPDEPACADAFEDAFSACLSAAENALKAGRKGRALALAGAAEDAAEAALDLGWYPVSDDEVRVNVVKAASDQ